SYERMIALVGRAEAHLEKHGTRKTVIDQSADTALPFRAEITALRGELSKCIGFPVILATYADSKFLAFAQRGDVAQISQQGPATPDHVIRTKQVPMVGRNVTSYAAAYRAYSARNAPRAKEPKTILDPAPRVVLDPQFGLGCVGRTAKDAKIVHDIYAHTMEVILAATALGGYRALPEKDIFDVEYWDLEQAKLKKLGTPPPFAGEVALVTGAASGISKACVESLLKRGAAVVGLDVSAEIIDLFKSPAFLGIRCDVTSEKDIAASLDGTARAFGGLDMLILNAGIFPGGKRIAALPDDEWRRVMQVNLDANLALLRECHPLLKIAPNGGRVVVIGSKNVSAPGPGAAAYSASKAALTQLARVAALEWGADHIRVNTLHPDAVFDTAIWTDEVL